MNIIAAHSYNTSLPVHNLICTSQMIDGDNPSLTHMPQIKNDNLNDPRSSHKQNDSCTYVSNISAAHSYSMNIIAAHSYKPTTHHCQFTT
jgi:hypothetical protein